MFSSHYTDKHILLDEKDESLGRHESKYLRALVGSWVFFGYKKYCLLSAVIEEDVIGLKILRATINNNVASNE